MSEDLKIIKKQFGEEMMHFCRQHFTTILEENGKLSKIVLAHFAPSHMLFNDLKKADLLDNFIDYIYSFITYEEKIEVFKTPKELLAMVGYELFECKANEDVQQFQKYYTEKEKLCTFKDATRINRCRIFFAVRKDALTLRREVFCHPIRQDAYGTSVICLQFYKNVGNLLSIKNRYNDSVRNSDSTYANNLDNIVPGLTKAFARTYGIKQIRINKSLNIPKYTLAGDGKYYKYNYYINRILYCPNNIVIKDRHVYHLAKERFLLFDYFLLDLKYKRLELIDNSLKDSFINAFSGIKNIIILREKELKKVIIKTKTNDLILWLDGENNLIGYFNPKLAFIFPKFLDHSDHLKYLACPNVKFNFDKANNSKLRLKR